MTRAPRADSTSGPRLGAPRWVSGAEHASSAHMTRATPQAVAPTRSAAQQPSSYAELTKVLCGLSWATPTSRDLASRAVAALTETRTQLASLSRGIPDLKVRTAVSQLIDSAGFVLEYWPDVLAGASPEQWSPEYQRSLIADLAQIALAGSRVLNLIETGPCASHPQIEAEEHRAARPPFVGARHRRVSHGVPAPEQTAPVSWAVTIADLAADPRYRLFFTTGLAMLALTGFWYLEFDLPIPTTPGSGSSRSSSLSSRTAAASEPVSVHTTSLVPSAPASTSVAAQPGPPTVVTSIQLELLGSSVQVPQLVVEFLIDTTGTGSFDLQVTWGRTAATQTGRESRVMSGERFYDFTMPIAAGALCGGPVFVEALAGTVSASTWTSAGPCPASTSTSSTTMEDDQ